MTWRLVFKHLFSKPFLSAFTLCAIAGALAILGGFWTVLENLERVRVKPVVAVSAEATSGLTLFVDAKLKTEELDRLKAKVMGTKKFSSIDVVPAAEALRNLESQFGEALSKAFTNETLPTTLKLQFNSSSLERAELFNLLNELRSLPGVIDVDDGSTAVPSVGTSTSTVANHVFSWASGLLILVFGVVALLVSHLIRMAFETLKPEVETLKVLGASRLWIFRPLFLEGLIFGISGGLTALIVLAASVNLVLPRFAAVLLPKGFEVVGLSISSAFSLLGLAVAASIVGAIFTWPLIEGPATEI